MDVFVITIHHIVAAHFTFETRALFDLIADCEGGDAIGNQHLTCWEVIFLPVIGWELELHLAPRILCKPVGA